MNKRFCITSNIPAVQIINYLVTEIEVKLFAEKSVKMPLFTGYVARGLLLNILNRINPVLSQNMHEPNSQKPYSVTPLYFKSTKKYPDGYQMNASEPCILKLRFLDDELVKSTIEFFSSNEGLMIYDTVFKIASLIIRTGDFSKVQNVKHFRLVFVTPTHLSRIDSKYDHLFPDPKVVFSHLMRVWDTSMRDRFGKKIYEKYKMWIEKKITVSGYNLRTITVTGKSMKIGFMGWCAYMIDNEGQDGSEFSLITNKLAKFAEYSNVGMERTAGFGVTYFSNSCSVD